jgi:hypothetical protein
MSSELDNEKILGRYKKIILPFESLVRIVTIGKSDRPVLVTINLQGTMISGELVSIENFHTNMKSTMLDNVDQKDDPGVYEPIRDTMQILENVKIMDENSNFNFDYFCIKDAKIHRPGFERITIPFWIGKLESVDGFFIGTL